MNEVMNKYNEWCRKRIEYLKNNFKSSDYGLINIPLIYPGTYHNYTILCGTYIQCICAYCNNINYTNEENFKIIEANYVVENWTGDLMCFNDFYILESYIPFNVYEIENNIIAKFSETSKLNFLWKYTKLPLEICEMINSFIIPSSLYIFNFYPKFHSFAFNLKNFTGKIRSFHIFDKSKQLL